ncbi:MAG: hypothetical protein COX07_03465 [Bacteroidetes bacterium CG23_combo_of_CG06-09_8_20_14_all_32_9]|nr:MAG: hypothetical protein COX07_03465 [Bacteroidetes bacterium CG23_combo_of_CG06-09_8_20_14_all_32_9]
MENLVVKSLPNSNRQPLGASVTSDRAEINRLTNSKERNILKLQLFGNSLFVFFQPFLSFVVVFIQLRTKKYFLCECLFD